MAGFGRLQIFMRWINTVMRLSRRKALGRNPLSVCRHPLRKPPLHVGKFIAGLGIPMVGRHAGRDLDSYFHGSWEAFEQAIQDGFDFTTS